MIDDAARCGDIGEDATIALKHSGFAGRVLPPSHDDVGISAQPWRLRDGERLYWKLAKNSSQQKKTLVKNGGQSNANPRV